MMAIDQAKAAAFKTFELTRAACADIAETISYSYGACIDLAGVDDKIQKRLLKNFHAFATQQFPKIQLGYTGFIDEDNNVVYYNQFKRDCQSWRSIGCLQTYQEDAVFGANFEYATLEGNLRYIGWNPYKPNLTAKLIAKQQAAAKAQNPEE